MYEFLFRFNYVNSIQIANQFISKVCISETTNDFAFIGTTPNKLYFYTGNCEKIGEQSAASSNQVVPTSTTIASPSFYTSNTQADDDEDDQVSEEKNLLSTSAANSTNNSLSFETSSSSISQPLIKSLCFSNASEGLNVNVIACGLSNGRIRFYSTWDLTVLREFAVHYDASTLIGSIISLVFSRDGRRLYASDTYARVYVLEAANSSAAQTRAQHAQLLAAINTANVTSLPFNYSPNFISFA